MLSENLGYIFFSPTVAFSAEMARSIRCFTLSRDSKDDCRTNVAVSRTSVMGTNKKRNLHKVN